MRISSNLSRAAFAETVVIHFRHHLNSTVNPHFLKPLLSQSHFHQQYFHVISLISSFFFLSGQTYTFQSNIKLRPVQTDSFIPLEHRTDGILFREEHTKHVPLPLSASAEHEDCWPGLKCTSL